MSEWDEKAEDAAHLDSTNADTWAPAEVTRFGGFMQGARWQREQFMSDDVIERVARYVNSISGPGGLACSDCGIPGGYDEGCEGCKRVCDRHARAAVEAEIEGGK